MQLSTVYQVPIRCNEYTQTQIYNSVFYASRFINDILLLPRKRSTLMLEMRKNQRT